MDFFFSFRAKDILCLKNSLSEKAVPESVCAAVTLPPSHLVRADTDHYSGGQY